MANNYIKLGNEDLIDLRSDTVEAGKMLQGTTAHDKSGTLISGSIQSGNVSLTLTPSNLSPSTSPNKYVPSASASLDYSSLTAEAANVASGKTFIGKNGVGTGSLVASQINTGEATTSENRKMVITGLSGSPSNVVLAYTHTSSTGIVALNYINGTMNYIYKSGSILYKRTSGSVTFSGGTCTITLSSDQFCKGAVGDKYRYAIW